ncbi:MAG: RluA family pseudouridine synthase [Clostridia bacterium]|nr:RluA family pseudouridine synthase [Clostridia bacterium]
MADIEIVISERQNGKYLRDILRGELKISSGLLTKLKKCDGIKVNGKSVTVAYKAVKGDILTVEYPKENSSVIDAVDIPLDIIYEDKYILAVNKPKDMPTIPSAGNRDNTLANACMYYFRDTDFVFRPVARLDRDTTGIVVIAKDARTSAVISEQMQKGQFRKTYYAITSGIPKEKSGRIDAPIGRADGSILKREVRSDGQNAITDYRVIDEKDGYALVEINLLTGRTHQIRVHFSHIGCPLLYDYMYGTEIPGETLYLHCGRLEFLHPESGLPFVLEVMPEFPIFDNNCKIKLKT